MSKKTLFILIAAGVAIALWAKFAKPVQWERSNENLGF